MKTSIHQEIPFKTSAKTLFEAYLDATKHSEFTGAPATIEPVEGSAFSLYGGGVEGRNVELVENLRLVQAWRGADWSEGIYSIVRMEFREKNGETLLILDHSGIPEGSDEHLDSGWQKMYWGPLQAWLDK